MRLFSLILLLGLTVATIGCEGITQNEFRQDMNAYMTEFKTGTQKSIGEVKAELGGVKAELGGVKTELGSLKKSVDDFAPAVKTSYENIQEELKGFKNQLANLEPKASPSSPGFFGSSSAGSQPITFRAKGTFNGLKVESEGTMDISEWRNLLKKQQALQQEDKALQREWQQEIWNRAREHREHDQLKRLEGRVTKLEAYNWRAEIAKIHRAVKDHADALAEADRRLAELAQRSHIVVVYERPAVTVVPVPCVSRSVVYYGNCLYVW